MKRKHMIIVGLVVSTLLASSEVVARNVFVNSQRMSNAQLQYLDQLSCNYIPDGRYWLNTSSGMWGYAGGGAQGYLGDNCNTRRRSLSERGMLYSPGELLR